MHDHVERDRFGNPHDFEEYLQRLSGPGRDASQHPDEVLAALDLRSGHTVCDIGCGPGYFALRMAPRVHQVFAVDVEARLLQKLVEQLDGSAVRNVTPILAIAADPLLPADARIDLALLVNTIHHFPDAPGYLRRLGDALTAEGRIALLEFREHKTPREQSLAHAEAAGLRLVAEHDFLPEQYFLVFRRR